MKNRTFMSFDLETGPDIQEILRGRLKPRSPLMSTSVRMCMDRLRAQGIALDDYSGEAEDVAMDMLTAEAVITGLAGRILSQEVITDELRELAMRPLLGDNDRWTMPDGTGFDLAAIPLLRDYARQIERLREACAEAL